MAELTLSTVMKNRTSIKVKDFFEIIHPTYSIFQVIPNTSIRNYNTAAIGEAIASLYRPPYQRFRKYGFKITYKLPEKASFIIDIQKNNTVFYLVCAKSQEKILIEKCREVWNNITLTHIGSIKPISDQSIKYQLQYQKEDALSLNVDKRTNEPLNSLLHVLDILEDDDRVCIYYNFIPISQADWRNKHAETLSKLQQGLPIDKQKFSWLYVLKLIGVEVLKTLDLIFEVLLGASDSKDMGITLANDKYQRLSHDTRSKGDKTVLNTQIVVLSDSNNVIRKQNNAIAVCESFKTLNEDNALIYKRLHNKKIQYTDYRIKGAVSNTVSAQECKNFIQIPGRDLLSKYKNISKIDTLETQIPKELQTGTKRIGTVTYRGNKKSAYFTTDKDYKNLAVVYIGPTRSGKTNTLCHFAKDSINAGESVIILDYIETCDLSRAISRVIPSDKKTIIDLGSFNNIQGLGYNELDYPTKDPLELYNNAKLKTNQLQFLISAVNSNKDEFTARMEKYLDAASMVGFLSNGSVNDIRNILENHTARHKFIQQIPASLQKYTQHYINTLTELDETNKNGECIGTKTAIISGISSRFNKLTKNTIMELMLQTSTDNNIDFIKEFQQGKAIFITLPENKFGTPEEKDIMVTYWLTKIWLALQARAAQILNKYKRNTVNIITDELAQLDNAQKFVGSKLDQCAKFGGKFVLSTMYINQLKIRENLRTANTSYILISGADKTNYTELKEELSTHGFTLEDLFNLKRFHSLNLIKYEKGYTAFISELPPKIT